VKITANGIGAACTYLISGARSYRELLCEHKVPHSRMAHRRFARRPTWPGRARSEP